MEAALLFERDEWEAAYILNKRQLPRHAPGLNNEVIRLVAQRGGFLGRESDGEPGVKTIWQGLQRVMDFVLGLRFARGLPAE